MIEVRAKKANTDSGYRWTVDIDGHCTNFHSSVDAWKFIDLKRLEFIAAADTAIACTKNMRKIIKELENKNHPATPKDN